MKTAAPVGDFESRGRSETLAAAGGLRCWSDAAGLLLLHTAALLAPHPSVPVSAPAIVPGAQGPVALLQVHGVQVPAQLVGHGTGPAPPGDTLSGFQVRVGRDGGAWERRARIEGLGSEPCADG